jgi:hypothetical protein
VIFKPLTFFKFPNYAQCPTPLVMEDRVRVYFSQRSEQNQSFIRYCDLDIEDPTLMLCEGPRVLENGKPGTFDDEGQIPSFALRREGKIELWYSGWNTRNTIPYHNSAGFAVSENGGRTFKRVNDGPVLDRTPTEPYLAVTPCFVGNDIYYISGLRWELIAGRYEPIYGIRKAWRVTHMGDGVVERPPANEWVIHQKHDLECFSRPWVVDDRMFYSYRSAEDYRDGENAYQIGMAERCADGKTWIRADYKVFLPRSDFDQKMQAYPSTFEAKGKTYLLWNGSGFGKHGFAIGVLE